MHDPIRILYAAGPGNVIGTFRHWRRGQDDPSQVAITYSGQFYDVCQQLGAQAVVVASNENPGYVRDGQFEITHRPVPFAHGPGPLYHLAQIVYNLRLVETAIRRRVDVAVVCGGTHWFVLQLLDLAGISVVPTLHCVLWHRFQKRRSFIQRTLRKLNALFFARNCAAMLSVSDDVSRQVRELISQAAGDPEAPARPVRSAPIMPFTPIYRPGAFDMIPPPPESRRPFTVMFAGRVERNKGVFDLLEIARRLDAAGRTNIEFDLCGDGSVLRELRRAAQKAGLSERFRCHGHCDRRTMFDMYGRAHVVIAPTTTDFIEGFNKVVVEGVLAGRPVITSSVCPSLGQVRDAVIEVPPDNVDAYTDAILALCDDPALYAAKREGCAASRARFYDARYSWASGLRSILERLQRDTVRFEGRSTKRKASSDSVALMPPGSNMLASGQANR